MKLPYLVSFLLAGLLIGLTLVFRNHEFLLGAIVGTLYVYRRGLRPGT